MPGRDLPPRAPGWRTPLDRRAARVRRGRRDLGVGAVAVAAAIALAAAHPLLALAAAAVAAFFILAAVDAALPSED